MSARIHSSTTLIFNPTAGAGRARRHRAELEAELQRWPFPPEVVETEGRGHATELAMAAVHSGASMVIAAGGDGTAHETVQGLLTAADGKRETTFAYLPLGTGCDFATSLGLPHDLRAVARGLPHGRDLRIDVGVAEQSGRDGVCPRYFLNAANVGLGPEVAARVAKSRWLRQLGTPAYLLAAIPALIKVRPQEVCWRTDEGLSGAGPLLNLSACNGPSFGGGMRPCPQAALTSGRLHVAVVGPLGIIAAARQIPRLMRGRRLDHAAVKNFSCRALQIDGPPLPVETDGEVEGELPTCLSVRPGGLLVRLPV
ncbi:MAG: diacylglycerol/lipid kinase family protein [Acidobacteriota bacterium]